ncbi:MAG: zinc ribbon domain-containing protein, partial [Bryobacteraceae bacterium]
MSSFCINCGSPLTGNSAFCPQCGKPVANRGNAPAYAPMAPPPPAPKSSGALKIVIVVLCCLAVGAAALIGGALYLAHRVKQAIVQKAAENGVNLHSLVDSGNSHTVASHPLPQTCTLLTKDEASRLIGEPVQRAEMKDAMCAYYGPPGLSSKLRDELASSAMKRVQAPGADPNAINANNSLDQIVGSLGAQTGLDQNVGEAPLLMLLVDPDGRP